MTYNVFGGMLSLTPSIVYAVLYLIGDVASLMSSRLCVMQMQLTSLHYLLLLTAD